MAVPRLSVEELTRQLATERQLRFATEQTVKDLRRDNARLASMSRTRTHYVILVPRPKWGVIHETLRSWGSSCIRAVRRGWADLKQALWPEISTD